MTALKVEKLCKRYSGFYLDNVSFELEPGSVMGFIGRNGAGKSTTLNSIINFVHPDSGNVELFGMNFKENEAEIKQNVGFASGGVDYFRRKKISTIIDITKRFYKEWDENLCRKYLDMFALDCNKTPSELSEGMKVKLNLALALSHQAKLLILDEPTSGLDPVSREDLLEVFLALRDEGIAILFSTHIISDLDKCADHITYIKKGRIIASTKTADFVDNYRIISLERLELSDDQKKAVIGTNRTKDGYTCLIKSEDCGRFGNFVCENTDLEQIMTHIEKGEN